MFSYFCSKTQIKGTRVPAIYVLSKNEKIIYFLSENFRFYSREKSLNIAWTCFRNVFDEAGFEASEGSFFVDHDKDKTKLPILNRCQNV